MAVSPLHAGVITPLASKAQEFVSTTSEFVDKHLSNKDCGTHDSTSDYVLVTVAGADAKSLRFWQGQEWLSDALEALETAYRAAGWDEAVIDRETGLMRLKFYRRRIAVRLRSTEAEVSAPILQNETPQTAAARIFRDGYFGGDGRDLLFIPPNQLITARLLPIGSGAE